MKTRTQPKNFKFYFFKFIISWEFQRSSKVIVKFQTIKYLLESILNTITCELMKNNLSEKLNSALKCRQKN